jgi:phosphate transporter
MKFSSSLKFNAVSEWWDEYIAYDSLKKCIYKLEKQQHGHEQLLTYDPESNERSTLLAEQDVISTDAMFIPLLDRELRKIATFYEHQEKELLNELKDLDKSLLEQEEGGVGLRYYDDISDEDDDDEDSLEESLSPERRRRSSSHQRRYSGSGHQCRSKSMYLLSVTHCHNDFMRSSRS